MLNFSNKLYKIKKSNYIFKMFGCKCWIMDILKRFVFSNNTKYIGKKVNKKYDEILLNKLTEELKHIINKYKKEENDSETTIKENDPIWVFWWQGKGKLPDIINITLNSIRKNSGKHPVIFLTKENVKDYSEIPNYIYEKLYNKTISLTNFADILRFNLLSKNGGIWIDATVLVTEKLEFLDNKFSLYSIHHQQFVDTHICQGKWSTFFIGMSINNSFAHYMNEMLLEYCRKYDYFVTYLLIDYFISIAYENIPRFHKMINKIPINNTGVFDMEKNLNLTEEPEQKIDIIKKDTILFKLTYKNKHFEYINGNKTIYRCLKEQYVLK